MDNAGIRTVAGVVLLLAGLAVFVFVPEQNTMATAIMVAGASMADLPIVAGLIKRQPPAPTLPPPSDK